MDNKKMLVYICKGCDIGNCLDIDALCNVAKEDFSFDDCKVHPYLCGDEGLEEIRKDLKEDPDILVIAGCSARFKTDVFAFDNCATIRINLREHVIWSHEPNDEDTQMLAEDYLRIGLAQAQGVQTPQPEIPEIDKTILVVGGGNTGITAAREAARTGYKVVLLERESRLGGKLTQFAKLFPKRFPAQDLDSVDIKSRIKEITEDDRITIYTSAQIKKISGQPGQFDLAFQSNGEDISLRVGAIVQATGWKPYDANKLEHLGYGKSPNVITNVQMEELAASGPILRPSDGKPAQHIAFIQCAGSRDADHLPYCSAVCCRVSIKQAIFARNLDSETQAYILYKDIRTPGKYEDFYRQAQEDPGIFFTKGEVIDVETADHDNLLVNMEDTLLGKKIRVEADLVVLATGMVPNAADGPSIRKHQDAKAFVAVGEAGEQLEMAKRTLEELKHHEGTAILQLDYRQGPDLPVLKYNFPDSNFICFPYETRRTGIYAAGCVRAPNDTEGCSDDAAGAVLKAIQSLEAIARGEAVHYRWGDASHAEYALQRCTQCKRCTEECPFGALNEDEKGTPEPNPTRCRRCGVCLGACPERLVSFEDFSVDIIASMIKSVNIPDEFDEKPRILGLICENDAFPALDFAGRKRIQHNAYIRFIPIRCLGSFNVVWIAEALSHGYDGILVVGCKSGDDYQCHGIQGSELMGTRSENIRDRLKQLALEEERVRVEELSISEYERLPEIINDFAEQIDEVGLNPFKGL